VALLPEVVPDWATVTVGYTGYLSFVPQAPSAGGQGAARVPVVPAPGTAPPLITGVSPSALAGHTVSVQVTGTNFPQGCPGATITGVGAGTTPQALVSASSCSSTGLELTVVLDVHANGPSATLTLTWNGVSATYQLPIVPIQMVLSRVGNTVISTDGKYTEDTTIKVTAVRGDNGATIVDFTGDVKIAEDATSPDYIPIYSQFPQYGGKLPSSVTISAGGTVQFVASSIAGPVNPTIGPPSAPNSALLKTVDFPVRGGSSLSIPQWVDNGQIDVHSDPTASVPDWVEAKVRDIYANAPAGGDLESVLNSVSNYKTDYLTFTPEGGVNVVVAAMALGGVVTINPFSASLRVVSPYPFICGHYGSNSFSYVYIHEARHAYQYKLALPVANNTDRDRLVKNIPIAPSDVFLDTGTVRFVCDEFGNVTYSRSYKGDNVADAQGAPDYASYALEEDAHAFAARHVP
jgi:hypothetical protein